MRTWLTNKSSILYSGLKKYLKHFLKNVNILLNKHQTIKPDGVCKHMMLELSSALTSLYQILFVDS